MPRNSAVLPTVLAITAGTLLITGCRAGAGKSSGPVALTSLSPSQSAVSASGAGNVPPAAPAPTSTSSTAPSATAPSSSTTPTSAPASGAPTRIRVHPPIRILWPRCRTAQLSATLSAPDGAAGNRYQYLYLRNTGAPCRMWGWSVLRLMRSSTGAVPSTGVRTGTAPDFTLAHGATASALVHWNVVPAGGEGDPCEPEADQIYVYPPEQSAARILTWTYGPVCDHGQFTISPMHL